MKTLEELGISLAPWVRYGDIVEDAEGNVIYNAYDGSDYQNANLISAAPKMYEAGNAAYDALEGLCPWYGKCTRCLHGYRIAKDGEWLDPKKEYCTKSNRKDCMVFIALSKLRAALAEASGEVSNG